MAENTLPNPNRYITTNDEEGTSIFSKTITESLPVINNLSGALFRLGYTTNKPPVELTNNTDLHLYETSLQELPPLVPQGGGANVWYIDTPPESESPLHRTVSLDFVIQIAGEIELTLSSGETRIVKPGDLTIQRSTLHKWRNPSKTQWSRMVGVMAECRPVVTGKGVPLGMEFREH
ncbi:hypothetical protein BDV24DRAFT_136545 [Aspergillus arachidicola]|uniref:Cupin domain protein n=1 Tax=Aspergillus arachidicola TaxID=656916 RepID=A0A2G7FKM0_9EURO|nr:hypothetical protein BDV24DRAFT_136545 [Aspergillus arachidicola]PIG81168.1 cupin domain protein [Aspergillus arachidicola]